jgi:hypothetical protein
MRTYEEDCGTSAALTEHHLLMHKPRTSKHVQKNSTTTQSKISAPTSSSSELDLKIIEIKNALSLATTCADNVPCIKANYLTHENAACAHSNGAHLKSINTESLHASTEGHSSINTTTFDGHLHPLQIKSSHAIHEVSSSLSLIAAHFNRLVKQKAPRAYRHFVVLSQLSN